LLQATWRRATTLFKEGKNVDLAKPIRNFWKKKKPTARDFLALEEHVVLGQMQQWMSHKDPVLSDLSRRFFNRDPLAMIKAPPANAFGGGIDEWENALRELVDQRGFKPAEYFVLSDNLTEKLYEAKRRDRGPYVPEPEGEEQVPSNAIRVIGDDGKPVEITQVLSRLAAVTKEPVPQLRYYVPREVREEAAKLRANWPSSGS
jgi:hypothetical protein